MFNLLPTTNFSFINEKPLLVKGRLTVMFEKNPSGGYLTKGNDRDGLMTRVVPGGKASLPSAVIHKIRFCLEWTSSFCNVNCAKTDKLIRMKYASWSPSLSNIGLILI